MRIEEGKYNKGGINRGPVTSPPQRKPLGQGCKCSCINCTCKKEKRDEEETKTKRRNP